MRRGRGGKKVKGRGIRGSRRRRREMLHFSEVFGSTTKGSSFHPSSHCSFFGGQEKKLFVEDGRRPVRSGGLGEAKGGGSDSCWGVNWPSRGFSN